ncbi:MAG: glycosyltransferase [Rhodospirillales bacterium]|nr:glycosyltransferase [Rhodospirillales bacterium]
MSSGLKQTARGPLVLLFFDGYDLIARPGIGGALYSQARRMARYVKIRAQGRHVRTGFYEAFLSLRRSLEMIGCNVRVNDFAAAEKNPDYPIGIAGYPSVLHRTDFLKNPRIFGPGDFGMPAPSQKIAEDPRFTKLIQPSQWFADIYRPYCGDKITVCPVGIDTERWPDMTSYPKTIDFLIYDKVHGCREKRVPEVLERIIKKLEQKCLSYKILRYGHHPQSEFISTLKASKALLFVCEHETQGLACEEAMAANIPVLAWDEGKMANSAFQTFIPDDVRVSSVPYFDETCGLRFAIDEFETACDKFWEKKDQYNPRQYVIRNLSMKKAGETYFAEYEKIARKK